MDNQSLAELEQDVQKQILNLQRAQQRLQQRRAAEAQNRELPRAESRRVQVTRKVFRLQEDDILIEKFQKHKWNYVLVKVPRSLFSLSDSLQFFRAVLEPLAGRFGFDLTKLEASGKVLGGLHHVLVRLEKTSALTESTRLKTSELLNIWREFANRLVRLMANLDGVNKSKMAEDSLDMNEITSIQKQVQQVARVFWFVPIHLIVLIQQCNIMTAALEEEKAKAYEKCISAFFPHIKMAFEKVNNDESYNFNEALFRDANGLLSRYSPWLDADYGSFGSLTENEVSAMSLQSLGYFIGYFGRGLGDWETAIQQPLSFNNQHVEYLKLFLAKRGIPYYIPTLSNLQDLQGNALLGPMECIEKSELASFLEAALKCIRSRRGDFKLNVEPCPECLWWES